MARGIGQIHDVVSYSPVHFYTAYRRLQSNNCRRISRSGYVVERMVVELAIKNLDFLGPCGITEIDVHGKAIELGLGEGIGPMKFDGVLRGNDQKRCR